MEKTMKTRRLGKTNLQVSEIGFGGEWLERHPEEEGIASSTWCLKVCAAKKRSTLLLKTAAKRYVTH